VMPHHPFASVARPIPTVVRPMLAVAYAVQPSVDATGECVASSIQSGDAALDRSMFKSIAPVEVSDRAAT